MRIASFFLCSWWNNHMAGTFKCKHLWFLSYLLLPQALPG
ncbi:hypothetical protein PGR6_05350 [Pseudomonas sp. GR 6-02]|nr:hypothetical protein PGR6_05350 [Pseudomonas sp. GR 6-02]